MASALQSLYKRHTRPSDLVPVELFNGIVKTLNSALSDDFTAEYPDLCEMIRENNEVFAAFKVHDQCKRMAKLLLDEEGNLKSFEQWSKEAEPISNHHNKVWLRTEYDTAIKRAEQARQWKQFESERDVLPNLRWVPSTAATPGADHMIFWDTVRPVDDPFWSQHKPGDRWGCQCSLEATDDPETDIPAGSEMDEPAPGLDNNPEKDGKLFSDSHPYFPSSCSTCPFNNGAVPTTPTNKARDCAHCPDIQKIIAHGGLADKLRALENASTSEYGRIIKSIISDKAFKAMEGHKGVYAMPSSELEPLLKVADRATSFGNTVYIMPNPHGVRSMDYVFVRGNVVRTYDLKSIQGQNSVRNRLEESIGQSRRVLLNMETDYRPRQLIGDIKYYFETYDKAVEVLIYKGRKAISIEREYFGSKDYMNRFLREWAK